MTELMAGPDFASGPVQVPDQRPARQLNGFARAARKRLRQNLRSPAPEPTAAPIPAATGRRAEAALLISAILGLRPDLGAELSIAPASQALIEPDLRAHLDRLAKETYGAADEPARIALINAIIRDWLSQNR